MLDPGIILQDRYRIVRPIGKGGMGAVYEAVDVRLDCTVALKETLLTDTTTRRAFEREARLLARLRHPTLPKVSDHFTDTSGQFLVMEFIPGEDLAGLMTRNGGKFPSKDVLAWGMHWADQLLDALQYLHTQSPPIIHQDIKPQNLKLTARGDIILLDFGLARGASSLTASTRTARNTSNLGGFTPNYAPLEQIRGTTPDPRSDLYALAATLYHILTGERPADALSRAAALLNHMTDPLRSAQELNPQVPPAVADILHKTLALNLDERYPTAVAMREALRNARSQSQPHGLAALRESDYPAMTGATFRIGAPVSHADQPADPVPAGRPITEPGSGKAIAAPPVSQPDTTGRLASNPLLRTLLAGSPVLSIAFNPAGQMLASGCEDHTIDLWQLTDASLLCMMSEHCGGVSSVAFHPAGQLLASGSEDRTVRLWWANDGSMAFTQNMWASPAECIAFSPDGQLLASGGWGGSICLWQVNANGCLTRTMTLSTSFVHSLAFSPDGKALAAGCYDGTVRIWRMRDGELLHTLKGYTNFVLSVAFSPDGEKLAASGGSTAILLWRMRDGRLIDTLQGHTNFVRSLAFSPDGQLLASGSEDKTVRLWQVHDGSTMQVLPEHTGGVTSVAFSPTGYVLASGSRDTKIRLWRV